MALFFCRHGFLLIARMLHRILLVQRDNGPLERIESRSQESGTGICGDCRVQSSPRRAVASRRRPSSSTVTQTVIGWQHTWQSST